MKKRIHVVILSAGLIASFILGRPFTSAVLGVDKLEDMSNNSASGVTGAVQAEQEERRTSERECIISDVFDEEYVLGTQQTAESIREDPVNTLSGALVCTNNLLADLDFGERANLNWLETADNSLTSLSKENCNMLRDIVVNGNPNLLDFIDRSGYHPTVETNLHGSVEFIDYSLDHQLFGFNAIVDADAAFSLWSTNSLLSFNASSSDAAKNSIFNVSTCADTQLVALFMAAPTVSVPTLTNITQAGATITGTYSLNGGIINADTMAYRYCTEGTANWITRAGTLAYTVSGGSNTGIYKASFEIDGTRLTPSTGYEVQVYIENGIAGTWSDSVFFGTLSANSSSNTVGSPLSNRPNTVEDISSDVLCKALGGAVSYGSKPVSFSASGENVPLVSPQTGDAFTVRLMMLVFVFALGAGICVGIMLSNSKKMRQTSLEDSQNNQDER